METERVRLRLRPGAGGAPPVMALREPNGRDELAVAGVDTRAALRLIDRLLKGGSRPAALTAEGMCAADRDALLAALHRLCWGDRIVATLDCSGCGERFDLSFQLSTLQRELYGCCGEIDPAWRVPLGEDELSCCEDLSPEEAGQALARACGVSPHELEQAATALEGAAPILDVDLSARCPECGHGQLAHFDLQSFLLQRLLSDRETLLDEVHLLAEGYGWSLREILGLGRATRRNLARRILDRRTP